MKLEIDMEIDKVIEKIKSPNAKTVCIQLPDGLKPRAADIQEHIKSQTKSDVIIWAGSCFGACDIPQNLDELGVDLLVQWGHSEFG